MPFQLLKCSNETEWNAFVDESPQGSIFCNTRFLQSLGEDYELYFVADDGNKIAAFPLLLKEREPLPAPYPYTCYQGIMFASQIEQLPQHRKIPYRLKVLEYLLGELTNRYKSISFCLHPDFDDIRAFQWHNYHEPAKGQFSIRVAYTGILDLQAASTEQYMQMVRTVRRQEYNRAQKDGVTVEVSDNVALLDQLHDLTFKRQSIQRSDKDARLVQAIASQSLAKGFGKLKIAKVASGEIASAILCLYDSSCAYYLFAANHPDFRKSFASTFLLFELIREFRAQGLHYFDFVGINSPGRGDYKVSFNATMKSYFNVNLTQC
jgi:hypothetical protein